MSNLHFSDDSKELPPDLAFWAGAEDNSMAVFFYKYSDISYSYNYMNMQSNVLSFTDVEYTSYYFGTGL